MFLSIILSALVSLLVFFFERWWTQNHPLTVDANAKQAFLSEVGSVKHFWMGKRRVEYAGKLFDKYAARFQANPPKLAAGMALSESDASALAQTYAKDLTLTTTELTARRLGEGARNYSVLPNGLVQGGSASYALDPATGKIDYHAAIKVGKWFLSKTYEFSGSYQVDPTLLSPTNLSVGKVVTLGSLQMRVTSLGQNTALMALTLTGDVKATGTAILATNLPVAALNSLDATLAVYGMNLALGVRPA